MEDFLKAVPLLTIEAHNPILEKQIEQLTEKTRDNEYIIKAKLQEKDEQLKTISSQFSELKTQMQSLMSSLSSMNETDKSIFAKQLFKGGNIQKRY